MTSLKSLIPRPLCVETGSISGILMVDGNIEQNVIQFRFKFSKTDETAPVRLSLLTAQRLHHFYCTIYDLKAGEIVSPVFDPGYAVGQCVSLIKVEPLIDFPNFDN